MSRSNSTLMIKNLSMQMVLYFATFVFGIITSRIILLEYGSEINGLISSINQFISYISLVELGLTSSAVYALYSPLAFGDNNLINDVLSATNIYYRRTGYVFLSLIIALCLSYPFFTDSTSTTKFETAYLVLVLGASGVINYFISAKYRILLIADQKQYILSIITIFSLVLNTFLIYLFGSVLHYQITTLRTICILTSLIPAIIITFYTRRIYKHIKFENRDVQPNIIKNRYVVFINEIAGNLHFGSPVIILTFIVNLLEVSVYSIYNVICNGISNLLNSVILPISSSFGSLLAKKEYDIFKLVYRDFEGPFYILSASIFAIAYKIVLPFVMLYTDGVSDVNYNRHILLQLFIINMFVSNLYNPQAILVRATGLFREIQPQTIIQAACTIVLGIPFTYLWGICGIVAASIISNAYRSISMIVFFDNKVPGVSSKITFINIVESIFVFFITIILISFLSNFVVLSCINFLNWFIYSLYVTLVSLFVAVLALLTFHKKSIFSIYKRLSI